MTKAAKQEPEEKNKLTTIIKTMEEDNLKHKTESDRTEASLRKMIEDLEEKLRSQQSISTSKANDNQDEQHKAEIKRLNDEIASLKVEKEAAHLSASEEKKQLAEATARIEELTRDNNTLAKLGRLQIEEQEAMTSKLAVAEQEASNALGRVHALELELETLKNDREASNQVLIGA